MTKFLVIVLCVLCAIAGMVWLLHSDYLAQRNMAIPGLRQIDAHATTNISSKP